MQRTDSLHLVFTSVSARSEVGGSVDYPSGLGDVAAISAQLIGTRVQLVDPLRLQSWYLFAKAP